MVTLAVVFFIVVVVGRVVAAGVVKVVTLTVSSF